MDENNTRDFLEMSGIVELDNEGLQCPLCSVTTKLRLSRLTKTRKNRNGLNRYRFLCEHCDTAIFFTRLDDISARRSVAFCRPEKGKEHEDYERN